MVIFNSYVKLPEGSDSENTSFSKLKADLVKDLVVDTLLSGFDDTDWNIVHEQLQRQPQIKHIDTSPEPPGGTSRNIVDFEWFSWIIQLVEAQKTTDPRVFFRRPIQLTWPLQVQCTRKSQPELSDSPQMWWIKS